MLIDIGFPPGFRRNGTERGSRGFWYTGQHVRWVEGVMQPTKGWRAFSTTAMLGMGRAIIAWKSGALAKLAAIGTNSHLYAMSSVGVLSDITPARASGTYANNPLSVVIGTPTVTVEHGSAHGLTTGDYVQVAGAAAIGGITPNGHFAATVVDSDTYTYTFTSNATSTVTGGGGAAVTYVYGISPGAVDSTSGGGYGYGLYGAGIYGAPRLGYGITSDARVWTLDTFGQYLIAAPGQWGDIYEWQLNTSVRAAKITNSPTALAIVVTEEAFVFALGAGGNPRNVAWCDQANNTLWTAAATNQAGDKDLQTFGKILCGRVVKGGTLVFTETDVHRFTFVGGTNIFNVEDAGRGCGIISAGAVESSNTITVWMGTNAFWIYDGYARPLECPIADDIFNDLNELQKAKVSCHYDSGFGEFTWYFPSSGSTENDRYVRYHSREPGSVWTSGDIARLSGCDSRGIYLSPMAVSSDGYVYEHEVGWDYDDADVYVRSATVEWPNELGGGGDRTVDMDEYWPDEKTAGDVTLSIFTRMAPNGTETEWGPYTAANPQDLRITGRQAAIQFTGSTLGDWRVGSPRINAKPGSGR